MTDFQKQTFVRLIRHLNPTEFHHGDCVGADAQAHDLVRANVPGCRIVLHIPDSTSNRAFCSADRVRKPLPYLVRNQKIISYSDHLIAAPKTREEVLRSGTWSTIRSAMRFGRSLCVLWPTEV